MTAKKLKNFISKDSEISELPKESVVPGRMYQKSRTESLTDDCGKIATLMLLFFIAIFFACVFS